LKYNLVAQSHVQSFLEKQKTKMESPSVYIKKQINFLITLSKLMEGHINIAQSHIQSGVILIGHYQGHINIPSFWRGHIKMI